MEQATTLELAERPKADRLEEASPKERSPMLDVLRLRDFRLLWTGESISLLGDQFFLIAMPWLVLQLTGNALAMGTILAVAGAPRALFMLVGGALTDRFSPRLLMLGSNLLRLVMVAALSGLVLTGLIQLWMLYVFALMFGLVDAFFFPAQSAMVPRLVGREQLQSGNALLQGMAQMSMFLGPVLAGILIAVLDGGSIQMAGSGQTLPDMRGIGVAFALDALSFLASAITLSLIRERQMAVAGKTGEAEEGVWSSIWTGLASLWRDKVLRTWFIMIAAMNLLVTGPIMVGIPVLANSRLPEGAAAYGIINSAFGAGSLVGIIAAGILPKPAPRRMGLIMAALTMTLGVELPIMGLSGSTILTAGVCLAMGMAQGYIVILFVTWLQMRTPAAMLGRMMSLLMFAVVGLAPLSTSVAGAMIDLNLTAVFMVAGVALMALVTLGTLSRSVREMGAGKEMADSGQLGLSAGSAS
jgi:hypothetical protein